MFQWETLKEIGSHDLKYQGRIVTGKVLEVELAGGKAVRVWRADNGQDYFCHGLTFGGKEAPGGAISPLSDHVSIILREHYESVAEQEARAGDIVVWTGADENDVVHSAILTDPVLAQGEDVLDYSARLQTKNGILPETSMTLEKLVEDYYGETFRVYRKRQ
jgi:hypothetical protein